MNRRGFILAASGLLVPPEPVVKRAWWFFGARSPVDPLVGYVDYGQDVAVPDGCVIVGFDGAVGVYQLGKNIKLTVGGRTIL